MEEDEEDEGAAVSHKTPEDKRELNFLPEYRDVSLKVLSENLPQKQILLQRRHILGKEIWLFSFKCPKVQRSEAAAD